MAKGLAMAMLAVMFGTGQVAMAAAPKPQKVHAKYVNTLHVEFSISKAMTLTHSNYKAYIPPGKNLVALYLTLHNLSSQSRNYSTGVIATSASPKGVHFPLAFLSHSAPTSTTLLGGTLRAGEKQSGWVGYSVPPSVKTIFVQYASSVGSKEVKMLLRYHPKP
jgi:hypothetical protein